mmetsp:Transcript_22755/g.38120  ORF Transcript_22755/g.38120 Transcript_22755/m.38120 type:complete len:95 (+) Transcript_22755:340-624(+)
MSVQGRKACFEVSGLDRTTPPPSSKVGSSSHFVFAIGERGNFIEGPLDTVGGERWAEKLAEWSSRESETARDVFEWSWKLDAQRREIQRGRERE